MTREEIEAGRSEKGGFTKAQLAQWGVPWPPPQGWKEALLAGRTMQEAGLPSIEPSAIRGNVSAHDLLRQVVLAVIEAGQAHILNDYDDVLAYFGGRNPASRDWMTVAAREFISHLNDTVLGGDTLGEQDETKLVELIAASFSKSRRAA